MNPHPIHSSDEDRACRWLALSAGRRTREDECEIALALERFRHRGQPVHPSRFPSRESILERVR